jgi:hypothetical protein
MAKVELDDKGHPVFLDDTEPLLLGKAESVGVARVDPDTRSGNPHHDVHSGKFGSGVEGRQNKNRIPQAANQDQIRFAKGWDAIRDAARENRDFDQESLKAFLSGRVNREPTAEELELLLGQIRRQRLADLADILHNTLRKQVEGRRKSRHIVRLQAPKGWSQRVFAGLNDDEVKELAERLEFRGWDRESLNKHVISRVDDEQRQAQISSELGSGEDGE